MATLLSRRHHVTRRSLSITACHRDELLGAFAVDFADVDVALRVLGDGVDADGLAGAEAGRVGVVFVVADVAEGDGPVAGDAAVGAQPHEELIFVLGVLAVSFPPVGGGAAGPDLVVVSDRDAPGHEDAFPLIDERAVLPEDLDAAAVAVGDVEQAL